MNDPHVESLQYAVVPEVDNDFSIAAEMAFSNDQFEGSLRHDSLTLRPKQHFASELEARSMAEPFLKAWEIAAGLGQARPMLRFRFCSADIVDRAAPLGHQVVALTDILTASDAESTFVVRHARYPDPPVGFCLSPVVEALWDRFCGYRSGNELLLSMAYFCLTLLEHFGGGSRRSAATTYKIDYEILDWLGELTSTRGDHLSARKLNGHTRPLTPAEASWLERAILVIGRHLAGAQHNELRMSDLPPLP